MGEGLLWVIKRRWIPLAVAAVTVASVLLVPVTAHAMPHPSDADFGYSYNPETQQIGFWFADADGESECTWADGSTEEPSPDSVESSATQCFVVDVVGPNGQVNHGTIVSAFVHELKGLLDLIGYDGPRGQFISQVAQGDQFVGTVFDSDDDDDDDGPPAWAEAKKNSNGSKNKGTAGGGNSGNGSSNANANAKGKGIGKNG